MGSYPPGTDLESVQAVVKEKAMIRIFNLNSKQKKVLVLALLTFAALC
jgi:hypothetical protein